jgi:Ca-activated chloride channel family protein
LIDAFGKATETNVPMTFYDRYSGDVRYNIMHTMNVKGNPDTINIDPLGSYNIVVHSLPFVGKDSIVLVPGTHNIIGIDAPQGDLILKIDGKNDYRELKAIVRKSGEMKTTHAQDFNTSQRYIVGEYDLEILSTPRIYVSNVRIDQSKTTTIQIPSPGIVNFQYNNPGYGYIVQEANNKLNLVHTLSNQATRESVVLQPGNYRVVYRPKNSQSSQYTIEKSFKITSGTSVSVVIN